MSVSMRKRSRSGESMDAIINFAMGPYLIAFAHLGLRCALKPVLVHGDFEAGSSWNAARRRLEQAGQHDVVWTDQQAPLCRLCYCTTKLSRSSN
jgi:hypothetical protein